jgi:hypothetical protein
MNLAIRRATNCIEFAQLERDLFAYDIVRRGHEAPGIVVFGGRPSARGEHPVRKGLIFEKQVLVERSEGAVGMDDGDLENPAVRERAL